MADHTASRSKAGEIKPKLSLKIKENKILRIENLNLKNEEAKILHIKNFKIEEDLKIKLENFNDEKFPKIFLIVIECDKNEFGKDSMTFLREKFSNYESMILQIISRKKSKFYLKETKDGEFFEIFMNKTKRRKKYVNIKYFLQRVAKLKISFTDLNIFEVFEEKSKDEILELFEKVIRQNDEDFIKILLLFVSDLNDKIIDAAIKGKDLKLLLILLNNFEPTQLETFMINLTQKNEINALKLLTESSQNFTKFVNFSLWSEMRKISHENNFYEFNFELQKLETELKYFSQLYDEDEKLQMREGEEKIFPKVLKNFHDSIREGNLEKVKEFVEKFPDFKICCDENQVCALLKAIRSAKFEIFSFLRSEGFLALNEDELKDTIDDLSKFHKTAIKEGTEKFSKTNPNSFINILCNKCDIFSYLGLKQHEENRKMLLKLSENEELKFLLIFTSQTEVKIIFDFKTESVINMDPNCSEHTMGVAYYWQNLLYVGKDREKLLRYGTFTHEMSHLMFYLLFGNKCLPYCEGDTLRENLWKEIVKREKENFGGKSQEEKALMEPIIRWVFTCYPPGYQQEAELAVRVNHILGRYIEEPQKVQELEEEHPEIFSFYRENVLPFLKVPHAYKIIKLNEDFEVLKSVNDSHLQVKINVENNLMNQLENEGNKIILTSNVPQLTFSQIIQEILRDSSNHIELKLENLFIDLEKLKNGTNEKILSFLCEESKVKKIFVKVKSFQDESLEILNALKLSKNQKIIFICNQEISQKIQEKFNSLKLKFSTLNVTHNFNDLTEQAKEKLLNQEINFQGNKIKVSDFIDFTDSSNVSQEFFNFLCLDKNLQINNQKFVQNLNFFIPRKINKKIKIISNREGKELSENKIGERNENVQKLKINTQNLKSTLR